MRTAIRLIALTLTISAMGTSLPALAANHARHRGYEASARASGGEGTSEMGGHRDKAIHDCSGEMNKLTQKDWGVMQNTMFAQCMTKQGEMP
jgi:hypothetical protein